MRCDSKGGATGRLQRKPSGSRTCWELEKHCEKLGVVFIPWSPMGGIGRSDQIQQTFPAFAEVATEVGATPQQVNLAWMLAKGSRVIPIPGSSRPETAVASAAAADIVLTPEQVSRLDAS